jgi:hypothetical protein
LLAVVLAEISLLAVAAAAAVLVASELARVFP